MCGAKRLLLTLGYWLAAQGCYSPSVEWVPRQGQGGTAEEPGQGAGGSPGIESMGGASVSGDASGPSGIAGSDEAIGLAEESAPSPIPTFLDDTLPDACVGQRFNVRLRAQGGGGNYYWQAQGLPRGLVLDPESGELQGTLPEEATGLQRIEIRLAASTGRTQREFQLLVRSACRFTYVGRVAGTDRLFWGDVRHDAESGGELSAGMQQGYAVSSFAVASNGNKVAYVARSAGSPHELHVAVLGDGSVPPVTASVPLPLGAASVVEYAWSQDGQWLAAVLELAGGDRVLGAYRGDELIGATSIGHLSSLFWVGERVCYHARAFQDAESIECRALRPDGFSNAAEVYYPNPGYVFEAADYVANATSFMGFVTDFPEDPAQYLIFQPVPGLLTVSHGVATPSPDLSFVARIEDGGAAIFPMGVDEAEPSAVVEGCLVVQAWSSNGRYLACRRANDVALVLLDPQGRIERQTNLADLSSSAGDYRHSFSPPDENGSVRWYVSDAADRVVRAIDLREDEWSIRIVDSRAGTSADRVALGYRRGTNQLLYHHDDTLELIELETNQRRKVNDVPLPFPLACLEDLTVGGRYSWCGGDAPPQLFAVSPDGSGLVFQSEQERLWSLDLVHGDAAVPVGDANFICEEGPLGCSDQVRFER